MRVIGASAPMRLDQPRHRLLPKQAAARNLRGQEMVSKHVTQLRAKPRADRHGEPPLAPMEVLGGEYAGERLLQEGFGGEVTEFHRTRQPGHELHEMMIKKR